MAKHYVLALLHEENGNFGIFFPDYPGVISGGGSFVEAVNRGANALSFHLEGMAEDGDEIRTPSNPEDLIRKLLPTDDGCMPALVEIDFPGKSVRINVSIEEGLLSKIDRVARTRGQSRSAFLASAALAQVQD